MSPAIIPWTTSSASRTRLAARLTDALVAYAVTVGAHVDLSLQEPSAEAAASRQLGVHQLTQVVQHRWLGHRAHRFVASERPQIARNLAPMMVASEARITASSRAQAANMATVVHARLRPVAAGVKLSELWQRTRFRMRIGCSR